MPDDTIATIPTAHRERLERLAYPVVMTAEAASRAADDLAFCQSVRQAVEAAKTETLTPLRHRLDRLRAQYDAALETIRGAEARVKEAILTWRQQERIARARAVEEAAAAQAALAGQEATHDASAAGLSDQAATEIGGAVARQVQAQVAADIAPAPLPPAVAGEAGTATTRLDWVFLIEDPAQVPREYLVPNETLIRDAIRRGVRAMPGVKIWQRETIVGRRR